MIPAPQISRPPAAEPVPRPQMAPGTRLTSNAIGFSYAAAPASGGRFPHPFTPSLSVRGLRLSRGLVDGIYVPQMGGKPMPEGLLELDATKVNAKGECWAVLEVEPTSDGVLDGKGRIEIVQSLETISLVKELGRTPIALILWKNKRPVQAIPVVHWNLRYVRFQPPEGGGPVRHLFL